MPNIKSAIKRVEVTERNRKRNIAVKSTVKTQAKKVEVAQEKAKKQESLKGAVKAIDTAVSKGVLHKNTAARKKSRLAKKANAAK